MSIIHIRYAGEALSNDQIEQELGLSRRDYIYIVATMALQNLRWQFGQHQVGRDGEPALKFDAILRNLIGVPLLSRTEELIHLGRAIRREVTEADRVAQIRHDISSWRGALAELAARGTDLTTGVPDTLRDSFVSGTVADNLSLLQAAFRRERDGLGRSGRSFEEAAREFIATNPLSVPQFVVMEGFTFLTPLQRDFVTACLARIDATVCFIYPDSDAQRRGFEIMGRTYSGFTADAEIRLLPAPALPVQPSKLQFLRRALFAGPPLALPVFASDDTTVRLEAHPHRHGEVAACMQRIREMLETNEYSPGEIAIIVRHSGEFDMLLQEQARLQNLPTKLSLPPRMLLLTPLGRFALTLYDIRRRGAFEMTAEQFETILASGWLGPLAQNTVGSPGTELEFAL